MRKLNIVLILIVLTIGSFTLLNAEIEDKFKDRTLTENIMLQCLPEDLRDLPPEEVEARQTLKGGMSLDR